LGGHGVWRVTDGATLYLTRHRAYDTTLKRFLSQDPLGLGGGANLYGYALGNPLSLIDPLGTEPQIEAFSPTYQTTDRIEAVFAGGRPSDRALMHADMFVPEGAIGTEMGDQMVRSQGSMMLGALGAPAVEAALGMFGNTLRNAFGGMNSVYLAPESSEAAFAAYLQEIRAAETTATTPRFLVTESGVAVPANPAELRANMELLEKVSTKDTAGKFLGTDSQGPLRVRIEQAHPETPGYTGPIDPLHTVDHLHIDRRLNGTTGPWQSSEKLPYAWPF